MLTELLQRIAEAGGVVATSELARTLGVSVGLVEEMIEQLGRLGYIAAVGPGCRASACRLCSQAQTCSVATPARVWSLTDKGRRLVGEAAPSR